ncbi:MAG TPA: Rad52/Rad22 family DNA repair protein [Terriglobales bacterium]
MSAPNGHAQKDRAPSSGPPVMLAAGVFQVPAERVNELVAALEVPFDPSQIEWRVMNTTKNQQPVRGQVVPYADQRAYTDRLNALFTPAGWTRRYTIHTSANFERSKDQKIAAKVLVTCELTIFGLGSHSATGEEWADDDNAGTAAEAQSFKRACACFAFLPTCRCGPPCQLRNCPSGRAVWESRGRANEQPPEPAAMASTMVTVRASMKISFVLAASVRESR